MTTYFPFVPSPLETFQFTPTFDGSQYTVTVTWNTASQRWFVNVTDQGANLIFALPMIGSPPGINISMTAGYFQSTLVYRPSTQQFEVSP
jgi:siroheme synthase (precorrin-2 oxidase/ferrochelatase)